MAKKKAIKIAAASAMAASSFAAVASVNASAASNVDTLIQQAVDQMQAAQDAFANPATQQNKAVDASVVQAEITKAQALYAQAKAAIAADGKWTKTRYAKLATTMHNFDLAVAYVNGKTIAEQFNKQVSDLNAAVQAKDLDKVNQLLPSVQDWSKNVEAQIRKATIGAAAIRVTLASVDFNNANTVVANATKFVADSQTPQVTGVSAINASQVLVKFNKAVDSTTAAVKGNYTLGNGLSVDTAVVQADGKSVLLTLTSNAVDNDSTTATPSTLLTTIQVNGVQVKDSNDYFPLFTSTLNFEDNVAPTPTTAEATTANSTLSTIKVTFSEPVTSIQAIKVDGSSVSVPNTLGQTFSLDVSALNLDSSKSHTIQFVNAKDTAGNVTATSSLTVTPVKDTVAPNVSSLQQVSDNSFLVTFDKDMNFTSYASGDIKVYDSNFTQQAISVTQPDTNNAKQWLVTLTGFTKSTYATTNSQNLSVVFVDKSVTDSLGNQLAGITKSVTLTKDAVAPTVSSVELQKDKDGNVTNVILHYSENVQGAASLANVNVVTSNGVLVSPSTLFGAPIVKDNTVTLPVNSPSTTKGSYNVSFTSGFVTDKSVSTNSSSAYSTNINFGDATSASTFDGIKAVSASRDASNQDVITVTYPVAVKGGVGVGGSAVDPSAYTLNGYALPAGTKLVFTDSSQKVVQITLPAGTISKTDSNAVFQVANVKSLDGTLTSKTYTTTFNVDDNTAPVLTSFTATSGTTLKLAYNEALSSIATTATVDDELAFYDAQGNKLNVTAKAVTVSGSGFENQLVVTLTGADATKVAKIVTVSPTSADILDASGVAEATDVTVTK